MLRAFFQNTKSLPVKYKNCLLQVSYGTRETSKLQLFRKKVTAYSRKL